MGRRIELNADARELMLAGFRDGRDWGAIRADLLEKMGVDISVRSLYRRRSEWRAEQRLLEMAREQGLAIAACDGRIAVLHTLAARIILNPNWRAQREKLVNGAIRAFQANPTPARAVEAQQQCWLLLFEHQLWTYQELQRNLRRETRAV